MKELGSISEGEYKKNPIALIDDLQNKAIEAYINKKIIGRTKDFFEIIREKDSINDFSAFHELLSQVRSDFDPVQAEESKNKS